MAGEMQFTIRQLPRTTGWWYGILVSMSRPVEDLLAVLSGEEGAMPLTDEEKQRIREIEEIRFEVQEAFQERMRTSLPPFSGPVVGNCHGCGKPLQFHWSFCPFCGASSRAACPRCHGPLPTEEGVQFCPQCGGRVER
jgi:hypothetical protein